MEMVLLEVVRVDNGLGGEFVLEEFWKKVQM